jgi:hypothetical protein
MTLSVLLLFIRIFVTEPQVADKSECLDKRRRHAQHSSLTCAYEKGGVDKPLRQGVMETSRGANVRDIVGVSRVDHKVRPR